MQLFSRIVTLAGPPAASTAYAVEMREYAANAIGREIALWAAQFGAPVGTMSYAMRVEGLADLQAATAPLLADAEYLERLAAGQQFVGGPTTDSLAQPLLGELGEASPPVGCVAMITTATMNAGRYSKAIGWGIDIAKHVSAVGGMPTMFLTSSFGEFGGVAWIAVAPDMATVDAAGAAVNADPGYLEMLDGAGDLFLPGSGNRVLMTRVA
jgi:hypothetical protein